MEAKNYTTDATFFEDVREELNRIEALSGSLETRTRLAMIGVLDIIHVHYDEEQEKFWDDTPEVRKNKLTFASCISDVRALMAADYATAVLTEIEAPADPESSR